MQLSSNQVGGALSFSEYQRVCTYIQAGKVYYIQQSIKEETVVGLLLNCIPADR